MNVSKVPLISSAGAPASGHQLSLATGSFRASHLSMLVQWATGRRRALGIDCDAATVTRAKAGIVASN
ncbi:MAG TPA: hypothetical protein VET87_14475 [Rubrivivax sp.]|nr:hypothetical protein [Rubrivivax sp.]